MRSSIAVLILLAATGAAVAGDNNEAYLIQLSPLGTIEGNTLSIDQEDASDSRVQGIGSQLIGEGPSWLFNAIIGTDPLLATQRGEGNQATVGMNGTGGQLQLLQTNFESSPWVPGEAGGYNNAILNSLGDSLGAVVQIGESNMAELSLDAGAQGLIAQWGTGLSATLNVASDGQGTIFQKGNGSSVGTVNVLSNNAVTWTQIGDGLTATSPGLIFSTSPGAITITQIAF